MIRSLPQLSDSSAADRQAFRAFYTMYAPKLWGCILQANLSDPQAEAILISTFTKAWKQFEKPIEMEGCLTRLLILACKEGLPTEALRTILFADYRLAISNAPSEINHPDKQATPGHTIEAATQLNLLLDMKPNTCIVITGYNSIAPKPWKIAYLNIDEESAHRRFLKRYPNARDVSAASVIFDDEFNIDSQGRFSSTLLTL